MEEVSPEALQANYSAMTDGELLSLAADQPSLTDTARGVLNAELRRRNMGEAQVAQFNAAIEQEALAEEHRKRRSRRFWRRLWANEPTLSTIVLAGGAGFWLCKKILPLIGVGKATTSNVGGLVAMASIVVLSLVALARTRSDRARRNVKRPREISGDKHP